MVGGLEYIRDRENRICLVELLKRTGRYLCNIQNACLDKLDHCAVIAELTVRVDVKGVIGFLLHLIAHRTQTDMHRMPVTVAVRNQQTLGVLTAAAAGHGEQRCARQNAGNDSFHAFHFGNSLHFILRF